MRWRLPSRLVSLAVMVSISLSMLAQVVTDADGIRHVERTCAAIEEGIKQLSPAPAILIGTLVKVVYSPRIDRLSYHCNPGDGTSLAVACSLARASPLA